jgi:peroxiredoxin
MAQQNILGGKVTSSPLARRGAPRAGILLGMAGAMMAAMTGLVALGVAQWSGGGIGRPGGGGLAIVSPGSMAPDFTLPSVDGRAFHLADYRGRAVFLAYVPTWTDPKTIAEARSLRREIGNFDAAGAKVMLISAGGTPEQAARLHADERLPFPVLLDTDAALARAWGVPRGGDFRTTFVVNPQGKVRYRLTDAAVDPYDHGRQLLDVSKCCMDDVLAARSHGIGSAVGDFSLQRMDLPGRPMGTLYGDGAQRATVVVFVSSRCPCSNGYNDRLRALSQRYAPRGIRFVGVYANQDEPAAEIAKHAHAHHFSFPVFRDEGALCADHFGASVTPEVFVTDARRVLRYDGRLDDNRDPTQVRQSDLANALDALLGSRPPFPADTRAFGCAIVRREQG